MVSRPVELPPLGPTERVHQPPTRVGSPPPISVVSGRYPGPEIGKIPEGQGYTYPFEDFRYNLIGFPSNPVPTPVNYPFPRLPTAHRVDSKFSRSRQRVTKS